MIDTVKRGAPVMALLRRCDFLLLPAGERSKRHPFASSATALRKGETMPDLGNVWHTHSLQTREAGLVILRRRPAEALQFHRRPAGVTFLVAQQGEVAGGQIDAGADKQSLPQEQRCH